MKQILKNKNVEIQLDFPLENYNYSRFDWTGKLTSVIFKNVAVTTDEKLDQQNDAVDGKGFYNEFGIEIPIGFEEIKAGEWFHKIGIGMLKKDHQPYFFNKKYELQPAKFEVFTSLDKISINCNAPSVNGYSYDLKKEIELLEDCFIIHYHLENTGTKTITTDEYNHNFIAINNELIDENYVLKFPFKLDATLFDTIVNPKENMVINEHEFTFKNSDQEEFFFSNLSGGKNVAASWELINKKTKIGIRETGSFETSKINLWGSKHVISPELFFELKAHPGETITWHRTYQLFEI